MPDKPGIEVLDVFPEIKALGQPELQRLCSDFVATPIAREFALSSLTVRSVNGELLLWPEVKLTHDVKDGEEYFIPLNELLFYIADNGGFTANVRDDLKSRIVAAHERAPNAYRRYSVNAGRKLPLYVDCKHCGNLMLTDLTAYRSEKLTLPDNFVECPKCGKTSTISGDDLRFMP